MANPLHQIKDAPTQIPSAVTHTFRTKADEGLKVGWPMVDIWAREANLQWDWGVSSYTDIPLDSDHIGGWISLVILDLGVVAKHRYTYTGPITGCF